MQIIEASFNNENLYSANKRIIKKDKIKIIQKKSNLKEKRLEATQR